MDRGDVVAIDDAALGESFSASYFDLGWDVSDRSSDRRYDDSVQHWNRGVSRDDHDGSPAGRSGQICPVDLASSHQASV